MSDTKENTVPDVDENGTKLLTVIQIANEISNDCNYGKVAVPERKLATDLISVEK